MHRSLRATPNYPMLGVLLAGLCLTLSGCGDQSAPPLNSPAASNAPVAAGTGDTPGSTPGTAAANGPNGPAGANSTESGNAPASKETASGKGDNVEIVTSMGTIEVELYPDKAPESVKNFESYVKKGFYDGTIFHRVIKDFMIQGGGFTKDMKEKKTDPPIKNEGQNGLKNERGMLAMARTGDPDSATAQFFINTVDNPRLDYPNPDGFGYAVFGKVTQGLDVVDKIREVTTTTKTLETPMGPAPMKDVPAEAVVIKSVKIKEASAAPASGASGASPSAAGSKAATPAKGLTPAKAKEGGK